MSRNWWLAVLLVTLLVGLSSTAQAARKGKSYVSFVSQYNTYTDLRSNGSSVSVTLEPSYDVELGLRLHSLFSLAIVGSQSEDHTRQGFGLGVRIDMPGFFLIGSKRKDSSRGSRKYPFNTSIFLQALNTVVNQVGGSQATTLATRYGVSVDTFLFNPLVFLTLHGGVYLLQGNVFSTAGAGLGVEF